MADLEKMYRALENADRAAKAGDPQAAQAAAEIARMIKQAQAQQQPEPGWGEALAGGAQRLPGDAWEAVSSIPGAVAEFASHPGQSIDQTLGGLGDLITGGLVNAGVPALSEQDRAAAELASRVFNEKTGQWSSGRAIKERIMNDPLGPIGDVATVASLATGGAGLAAKAAGAGRTASLLDKISEVSNPLTLPMRGGAKVIKGLEEAISRRKGAIEAGVPTAALAQVGRALGDLPEARERAVKLGPDAAAYDLSDAGLGQAEAIAGMPLADTVAKKTLLDRATAQREELVPRFRRNVDTALGETPLSQQEAVEIRKAARETARPLYDRGSQAKVEVRDLDSYLTQVAKENGNNAKLQEAVSVLKTSLYDPYAGKEGALIEDARHLLAARDVAERIIEGVGKEKALPGQNQFNLGRKDKTVGRHVGVFYDKINEKLHQIDDIREADRIYREAAEVYDASKLGRRDVVGTGINFPEPENIEARMRAMEPSEKVSPEHSRNLKSAARRGLGYRLTSMGGQLKEGLTEGAPALRTVTHENIKDRMASVAGRQAADEIAEMAGNQDLLMSDSQAIQKAAKQERQQAGREAVRGETPAYTRRGLFEQLGVAPTAAAAGAVAVGQPALGGLLLSKGILDRIKGKGVSQRTAAGMARLYAKSGADLGGLLDILENIPKPLRKSRAFDQSLLATLAAMGLVPEEVQ